MELRISGVTKEFDGYDGASKVRAVDQVDLSVEDGELVTLLGPSGCGKTTLLRMIAGFEDPTEGDIYFGDKRMNDVAPNRRNATLVFQSYAIFPHLNVFENIAFGLKLKRLSHKDIKAKMERVVDLVGLRGLENRQPSQLSGGQQQRVALARAIVMEPELLLFDEPLSNLDAKLREQMRIEIRRLQKTLGITSVYVTHDQAEAMSISDRVVVMKDGRIEQIGSPVDLYARPRNRFVADFIGKANFLEGTVSDGGILLGGKTYPMDISSFETGEVRQVVARPEAVVLSREEGHFPCEVVRTTFLGNLVEYEVECPDLKTLTVHQVNPITGELFRPGESIRVSLRPDTLHLLEKE
ncbi:ABC transporter related protein [Dethiosulfovibrio peptidovorans DSM 11002]|uniref:ABC transporter related protein n=1 Tax=Dethiosulfovibrio peptidovorans DSM 11002 TaxID=469381 RepID=D2Z5M8_9BACT|nr:ABC transporter ATP-binding protein [Dethiosulfovibrio peptidovorans]EFC90775.1 ABC transporter related protein [Dethiosulfovibrio peptidovorans DSM 11002]